MNLVMTRTQTAPRSWVQGNEVAIVNCRAVHTVDPSQPSGAQGTYGLAGRRRPRHLCVIGRSHANRAGRDQPLKRRGPRVRFALGCTFHQHIVHIVLDVTGCAPIIAFSMRVQILGQ